MARLTIAADVTVKLIIAQGGSKMKLRSMLLFSVVIASLTFVAVAGDVKEYELKFKGDGYFDMVLPTPEDPDLVFSPSGGFDLLNVSHLGLSTVVWELRLDPGTFAFRSGTFSITGANGTDSLEGDYSGFVFIPDDPANPITGTYDLDWVFTGGTGRFEGATGTGHTDGFPDFSILYAQFEFSGEVSVPEEDED